MNSPCPKEGNPFFFQLPQPRHEPESDPTGRWADRVISGSRVAPDSHQDLDCKVTKLEDFLYQFYGSPNSDIIYGLINERRISHLQGRKKKGCRVSLWTWIRLTSANVEGREKTARVFHCNSVPHSCTSVCLYWKGRLKLNAVIQ